MDLYMTTEYMGLQATETTLSESTVHPAKTTTCVTAGKSCSKMCYCTQRCVQSGS